MSERRESDRLGQSEHEDPESGGVSHDGAVGGAGLRRWKPPTLRRGLLRRMSVQIALVLFCVAILLLSSMPSPKSSPSSHRSQLDSTPLAVNNTSAAFPYLVNASSFPTPDSLSLPSAPGPLPLRA